MLTFFNAVPDRFDDGRNLAFVEGMKNAGFTQVNSVDADYALTWNLRSEQAREALSRSRTVAEQQELPTAGIDWYRGLAALSAGDLPAARESLERASSAGGPYGERAAELLSRL